MVSVVAFDTTSKANADISGQFGNISGGHKPH